MEQGRDCTGCGHVVSQRRCSSISGWCLWAVSFWCFGCITIAHAQQQPAAAAAAAPQCSNLVNITAASDFGLTDFSKIDTLVLTADCGNVTTSQIGQPIAVPSLIHWHVTEMVGLSQVMFAMTPDDLFVPYTLGNEVRFAYGSGAASANGGSGAGIEIRVPPGTFPNIIVSAVHTNVTISLQSIASSMQVTDIGSQNTVTVYAHNSSLVYTGSGDNGYAYLETPIDGQIVLSGNYMTAQLKGILTTGQLLGIDNTMLIQGQVAFSGSITVGGTTSSHNQLLLNGGNLTCSDPNFSINANQSVGDVCRATTQTVTLTTLPCTVTSAQTTFTCQAFVSGAADNYGRGSFIKNNMLLQSWLLLPSFVLILW